MNEEAKCCRSSVDVNLIVEAREHLNEKGEYFTQNAKVFALLGNAVRLKIISLFLGHKRMCVCDLADVLGMKQSPISQHLRKLKDANLLDSIREGMTIFYFIPKNRYETLQRLLNER